MAFFQNRDAICTLVWSANRSGRAGIFYVSSLETLFPKWGIVYPSRSSEIPYL